MAISYKKLWKLLIDKDMKKKDLALVTGISSSTLAKLGKTLNKICIALECDIGDMMEITNNEK